MRDHRADIQHRLIEHLQLTFVAVGIGLVIAVVLSLIVLRLRFLEAPVTWITGTLYTIPSLALFGFLIPLNIDVFGAKVVGGIGPRTAIAALPERMRTVITLRDVDGWTSAEVCDLLDLSEANQRVILHRARARVRQSLEDDFVGAQA